MPTLHKDPYETLVGDTIDPTCVPSSERSDAAVHDVLDRMLGRVVLPISEDVEACAFFFLSPPFSDRRREHVQYYGIRASQSNRCQQAKHQLLEDIKYYFSSASTAKDELFDRVKAFLPYLRQSFTSHFPNDRFDTLVRDAAGDILRTMSVPIGSFEITDAGPVKRDYITLLDYAIDFIHATDDKDLVLAQLNKAVKQHARPNFRFKTNSTFVDPSKWSVPIDNTLFSTEGYLTWSPYIRLNEGATQGTLVQFMCEFLYSLADLDRLEHGPNPIALETLRQTHLPLATLGQYRGSVCWISHEGRSQDKCASIVHKLDAAFQAVLSENFTVALLDAFRSCLSDALMQRAHPTSYYNTLAKAFGYLLWSYEFDFIREGRPVARCRDGRVEFDVTHVDLTKSVDTPISINSAGSGTDVTFHIKELVHSFARHSQFALDKQDVVDLLKFDTVVCRALHVHDHEALLSSGWMIQEKLCAVLSTFFANLHRMMGMVSHVMGHQIRHACTERGSRSLADRLERQLHSDGSVVLKKDAIETLIGCLRSDDMLFGVSEMFRRIDCIISGRFPREWQGTLNDSRSEPAQMLEQVGQALEATIHNLAVAYCRLSCDTIKKHGEAVPLLLRRLSDGLPVNYRYTPGVAMPGFACSSQLNPTLAVTVGLLELCRNAFLHSLAQPHLFLNNLDHIAVWYDVRVDVAKNAVIATVCNASTNEMVKSRSIQTLSEIGGYLGCISLAAPSKCSPPPLAPPGVTFVAGTYELRPNDFRFEEYR